MSKESARITAVLSREEQEAFAEVARKERERLGLPVTMSSLTAKLIREACQRHREGAPVFFDPNR